MRLIDRATSHFKELLDAPRKLHVPEWDEGDDKAVVYFTPLTLQERGKLSRISKDNHEAAAEMLILKAKDKDGNPLFTREDKLALMKKVDSSIIARIAKEMCGDTDEELLEQAEGN